MSNDSTLDTTQHIARVRELMIDFAMEILRRAKVHDASKLQEPEKSGFDNAKALSGVTYNSDEYKKMLADLKPALDHHYANNSHHPEHYPEGVDGMDLHDLVEMFFDWKAAGERHKDGNIYASIAKNQERFGLSPQLCAIMLNTADRLGYGPEDQTV